MIEKSKAEHEEVKRLFSQHNIPVDENSWMLPFQGTGAETASGYAKIGGSRTYKEAMRKAKAAEQSGDWKEHESQEQIAWDIATKDLRDAQRLVAQYGDRRDEMIDEIEKAIYDRPLPQPDAEKLDEWYKSVMPSGWYNFYNKAQFENLADQLIEKVGPEKAEAALDAMRRFQSTAAERRLAEGSQEGANVMPVALRYANPYVHDFEGKSYRDETYSNLVDRAILGGHDALILKNTYDPGGGPARLVDVGVVFDPGQIRSKFAEFNPEQVGSPDITKAKGGEVDHALRDWHEKNMAAGGEVHMQGGGDLRAQVERQLAQGVPVFADRGIQGQIAKQILDEQEAARLKEEEERRARIESLPFSERLAGRAEAARTLGSAVGRSMVAPYVAVAKGEEAAKQFAEDIPIPKTEAGAYYTGTAAEMLEGPAKFMQAAKIPDTPLTELVPTQYLPGLGRQLSGIAAKAARGVDAAIPDELKGLPVGGSIQPVGPGGEKLSINELIRRLEAGEEMTPEQRQRAEYSKAQKEKYAQANIARQAKEPAPKEEKVKVPANELGFYSSVEKGLANTARAEGSGQDFINDIMKANPSSGELEGTGIVDWLKTKDRVTKEEVQNYLDGHKIEIEETVRGTILSREERQKLRELERAISKGWYDIPQEDLDWYEATKLKLQTFKEPKHERESLMLPGGKNYKEIVLTLPNQPVNQYDQYARTLITKYGEGFDTDLIDPAEKQKLTDLWNKSQSPEGSIDLTFRSSHFPEKNILAHMRIQDMTLGGKKTLVIEEIQSDWHQQGRKLGYGQGDEMPADDPDSLLMLYKDRMTQDQINYINDFDKRFTDATPEGQEKLYDEFEDWRKTQRLIGGGVPDAPFKKDWYQLAIRRLMKYAADNDYDQIALVGPEEQIRRGSLGTYVDGLTFEKNKDGSIKLLAEKDQSVILDKTVKPEDLELYVGKSVAKKILGTKDVDGTLSGDDLMIGGEGMRQYYGRTYPDSINRIGKKYNANIEKREHILKEFTSGDVELLHTGEYDRHGKGVIAYGVRDPETDEYIAYEYDFEKALKEANKKAPSTSMWFMDLPANLKADVKVGQPFAKGGAVTKDKDLIRWQKLQEFARGGTVQKLAKVAEKVGKTAKRMSREEAEKAGLYHDISGIKLKKPLADVKVVIVDDPKAKMQERVEITPEALYGGASVPMFGDRSDVGKIVKEIEGVPMDVVLEGGGEFMRKHPKHIWASHPDRLEALAKKVRMAGESGRPVYGVHSAMGPQSVDFSTMVTEAIMAGLDLGSLRKEEISAFNQAVKSVKGQGGKPKAPNFPGLEDPELFQKLMSGPGGQRDAFLKAMDKRQFQEAGFPSVAQARYAVTAPRLLDVERGASGYAVGEFDPAGVIEVLSGHKSYPADIRGQYKGALPTLLPVEIMYPTHYGARRMLGATHDAAIKSIESQLPIQYHDQEWLDNAMKYLEMQKKLTGQKKGGLASLKKIRNSRNG